MTEPSIPASRGFTRPGVDPEILSACTRISRWKSLALCVGIYVAAVLLAFVGGRWSTWLLALPAMVLIAGLQMHLLILLHEGAHLLLHPNRKVNDLIADIFCAVPFFILEKNYRCLHLTHHKYSGQPERDPEALLYATQDYRYARRPGWSAAKMLFLDVCGWHALAFGTAFRKWIAGQQAAGRVNGVKIRDVALFAALWGGSLYASWRLGFWPELLVFWVLPQLTFMFGLLKIHGYGEHTGATGPTEFERTWIHQTHPVEDFFLAPIWSGYHLEHHFFPRVPWYHMRRFRKALLASPQFCSKAEKVTVKSYLFGSRSILRAMIWGNGEYRAVELEAQIRELDTDDIVSRETKAEVDDQLSALTPTAADALAVGAQGSTGRLTGPGDSLGSVN